MSKAPRPAWLLLVCGGVVFTVLGSIGACCGLAVMDGYQGPFWPGMDAPPGDAALQTFVGRWGLVFLALDLAGLALAFVLAIAGVGLFVRTRWSIHLLFWWSIARFVHAVALAVLVAFATAAQMSGAPPGRAGEVLVPALLGMCVAFIWRTVFPCVILLTLRSRTVRWDIASWSGIACHSCGYDMRASPLGCPECGAAPLVERRRQGP